MRRAMMVCAALAVAGVLAACEKEVTVVQTKTAVVSPEFAKHVVTREPAGSVGVAQVKASAKEGDEVVVRGRVGGSGKPIVAGRAVFTLADSKALKACNENPGDSCPAPWDFCCHSPEEIAAATISVQVVGADGRPVATDVEGSHIHPLTTLVVKGKVGPRPDPKVLVVDATEIYVVK